MLSPPLSMGNRYGYVIATGDTSDEAKANAINAASHIKFYLEPYLGVKCNGYGWHASL